MPTQILQTILTLFEISELAKAFFSSQLFGIILGSGISAGVTLMVYRLNRTDSREAQKISLRRELDGNQINPLINILKGIITILDNNSLESKDTPIPIEYLSELKIRVELLSFVDDEVFELIRSRLYNECLKYNSIVGSAGISFTDDNAEKILRSGIELIIIEILQKIKNGYLNY